MLSPYERSAIEEMTVTAHDPYRTPFSVLVHASRSAPRRGVEPSRPLRGLSASSSSAPPSAHAAVGALVAQALERVGRLVTRTVPASRGVERVRGIGAWRVRQPEEIAKLDLWEVDEGAAGVKPKYVALGALLGVIAGAFGTRGLAADAPLVAALGMRAVSEYAICYGFDPRSPDEQAYATRVFAAALAPEARALRDPQSASIDTGATLGAVAEAIGGLSGALGVARALARFGRKVLATRAARVAPVLGALAGAALNAWTLLGVARTAELAYQQRFLARKHGAGDVRGVLPARAT